jgi:outer membrane immunogenic protein
MKARILSLMAGTAAIALASTAASAADLPVRAAPPPVIAAVPVFTWTGFYVGVNAGYGWHDSNNSSIFVPAGVVTPASPAGLITYSDDDGDGFVGGGQVGYNYQFGSFVLGVEADLQWADLGGSGGTALVPDAFLDDGFAPAGVAGGIDWFGTVRARAGFAFDRALVYATGGFAYGGADDNNDFFSNNDDVRTGWTLGGGVEYAFTNNLTLGLEGLWVNLEGDNNGTFIGTVPAAGGGTTPVFVQGDEDDNEFFVARAKLNFKFGTY